MGNLKKKENIHCPRNYCILEHLREHMYVSVQIQVNHAMNSLITADVFAFIIYIFCIYNKSFARLNDHLSFL